MTLHKVRICPRHNGLVKEDDLRKGILVSFLALAAGNGRVAAKNTKDTEK